MLSQVQLFAFMSALLGSAHATHVYTTFLDSNSNKIGSVNYDVSNTDCFLNSGSTQIEFSQQTHGNPVANGPYCLRSFNEGTCGGDALASQQFQDVLVDKDDKYQLDSGIQAGPWKTWHAEAC